MSPRKYNHPASTDELLRALPKCVPILDNNFGRKFPACLMLIPESDGKKMTARYYSMQLKMAHGNIPMMRGKSANSVLKKMYVHFRKNTPEELNKKWEK
jgi:hypothetical protein